MAIQNEGEDVDFRNARDTLKSHVHVHGLLTNMSVLTGLTCLC